MQLSDNGKIKLTTSISKQLRSKQSRPEEHQETYYNRVVQKKKLILKKQEKEKRKKRDKARKTKRNVEARAICMYNCYYFTSLSMMLHNTILHNPTCVNLSHAAS